MSNYKLELTDEISAVKDEVNYNRNEFGTTSKESLEN